MIWSCDYCGRCYKVNKRNLTDESEKKMKDLEKTWLKQGEPSLCCRESFDLWFIKGAKKK